MLKRTENALGGEKGKGKKKKKKRKVKLGQGISPAYRFQFLKILDSGLLSLRPRPPHARRAAAASRRSLFNLSQHLGWLWKPVPGH